MPNHDELMKQMAEDDLRDELEAAAEGVTKMTVVEYAKAKGEQPQLIYYYIRRGYIKQELCVCGRKVIDVAGANAFLTERDEKAKKKAGGVTP